MNLKLFTEFLAQLKESRLISAANNPQYPTSKIGLGASEAKGNALRKIQEIQQQQEQLAQMQQQMQNVTDAYIKNGGRGDATEMKLAFYNLYFNDFTEFRGVR